MFQDLDSTLNTMLSDPNDQALPAELRNADKRFAAPDRAFAPTVTLLTVNLFLYDVTENRELPDPMPITLHRRQL